MLHSDTRASCVQELLEDGLLDQFHKRLVELNMDSAEELQSYINKLQLAVEQGRQKLLHSDGPEGKTEVGGAPHDHISVWSPTPSILIKI